MRRLHLLLGFLFGCLLLSACGNATQGSQSTIHQSPLTDASGTCTRNATADGIPVRETGPCQYTFTPHQRMTTAQNSMVDGVAITNTIIFDVQTSQVFLQDGSTWDPIHVDAGSLAEISPYWVWEYPHLHGAATVGTETLNGVQAQHVHGTLASDARATVDVWIGIKNGFPLKWIATLNQDKVTSTETILFTQWNTGVVIPLP